MPTAPMNWITGFHAVEEALLRKDLFGPHLQDPAIDAVDFFVAAKLGFVDR